MNDSLVRKFCESPQRRLIVIIATTLFGLLVLIPLVDDYFNKKASHSARAEDLHLVKLTTDGLAALEQQVAEVTGQLDAIESRTVVAATVSRYRTKVVNIVREAGCQVRSFDVSTPARTDWKENDHPLELSNSKNSRGKKTPFSLEKRNATLLIDGSMESVQQLLTQLHKDDSIAYLKNMVLQSAGHHGEQVTLKIEMLLFALGRQKA